MPHNKKKIAVKLKKAASDFNGRLRASFYWAKRLLSFSYVKSLDLLPYFYLFGHQNIERKRKFFYRKPWPFLRLQPWPLPVVLGFFWVWKPRSLLNVSLLVVFLMTGFWRKEKHWRLSWKTFHKWKGVDWNTDERIQPW